MVDINCQETCIALLHQIINISGVLPATDLQDLNPLVQVAICLDRSREFETHRHRSGVSAITPRLYPRLAHVAWTVPSAIAQASPNHYRSLPSWQHYGKLFYTSKADGICKSLDLLLDAFAPSLGGNVDSLSN